MENSVKRAAVFEKRGVNLIIHLMTDLDHHCETGIREEADSMLEEGSIRNIIFDFSRVDFMDSSGIGLIMGRYKKTKYCGGKTVIFGIGENIKRIMKMSGMLNVLEVYENEDAAVGE